MPDTKPRDQWTAEDYREHTIEARRNARYRFASDRIDRILDGSPELTEAQRQSLALKLYGAKSA